MAHTVTANLRQITLELLQEYCQTQSADTRNKLVQMNLGLVRKEAHHWINQCNENYEDLLQVGSIGLIRAIERFDTAKGYAFSSFAIPYIRGEIQHYLRDKGCTVRIPRRWQNLRRQSVGVIQNLRLSLNRQPSDLEIALALDISVEEWQQIRLADRNRELLSLDAPVRQEEEGVALLGDLIPDQRYRSFQLAQEDRIRLQQALFQLEKRTREVLEFVFLQDLTQRETAEKLGISAVTVSRRIKKGLDYLKSTMTGQE